MTKEEKLAMAEGIFALLEEADFYECAISHGSYFKGMIAVMMMDGSITPKEWTAMYDRAEAVMKTKYNLKSVTQGVPF